MSYRACLVFCIEWCNRFIALLFCKYSPNLLRSLCSTSCSGPLMHVSFSLSYCRCVTLRRNPLFLAVPSLQRPELGSAGRLLPRRILYDVRHPPGAVQAGSSASLLGLNWTLNGGSCSRHHHVDFPHHFAPYQPLHLLPRLSVLQGCRPQQLQEALLLQSVAFANAAACHVHVQEIVPREGRQRRSAR